VPPQSVATAYRREVFGAVGTFDERFDACEDVEFNHRIARAGLRCFFTPRVRVRYHPRATLAGLFRQMIRYGRGRVRLLRKYPDSFSVPGFLPAVWLCGLIVGALASFFSPLVAAGYLAALALYLGCVLAFSVGLGVRQRTFVVGVWLPLVYVTIHLGAGVGLVWEAVQVGRMTTGGDRRGMRKPATSTAELDQARRDWSEAA
jgi:succinoglycan biosynthesis protein ExoA